MAAHQTGTHTAAPPAAARQLYRFRMVTLKIQTESAARRKGFKLPLQVLAQLRVPRLRPCDQIRQS